MYSNKKYLEQRESRLRTMKEYYKKNSEKIKERTKIWYNKQKKNDPTFLLRVNDKSKKRYLEKRYERLAWHKEHHKKNRLDLLNKIGKGMCSKCGFTDWRALQIDHIDGKGHLERKMYKGKKMSLTRKKQRELIEQNPSNYQILCANCNWIKRYENQEGRKITK